MIRWFEKLKWISYSTFTFTFTELDKYADHTLENGIRKRVNTGEMLKTNKIFPYEAIVRYPNGNLRTHSMLNKQALCNLIERLNNENPER